jgi:hypothetical protein
MHDTVETKTTATVASRVVPDPNRPGPSRVRLEPESIPVWALIGQGKAIAEARHAALADEIVVRELARDYGISPAAVRVALDWYARYPNGIDAWLADNAAHFDPDATWFDAL